MYSFLKRRNLTKVLWKQEKYKNIYLHLGINQTNMNKGYLKNTESKLKY